MDDIKIRVIDSKKLIEAINAGSYEINLSAVMALGAMMTQSASTEAISFERREGMNIKTCDKCGVKINTDPIANTTLPMLYIRRIEDFITGWQTVDLCPKCQKMLAEWLNDNGVKSNETD